MRELAFRRKDKLTPERRSEIASNASKKRWDNRKSLTQGSENIARQPAEPTNTVDNQRQPTTERTESMNRRLSRYADMAYLGEDLEEYSDRRENEWWAKVIREMDEYHDYMMTSPDIGTTEQ